MATKAKRLLNKTQEALDAPKTLFDNVKEVTRNLLGALFYARILISVLLLGWVIYITYKLSQEEEGVEKEETRAKYFYMHRVWFGEESIALILFNLWYYSFIFLLITPVISWFSDILKLYLTGLQLT